MEPKRHSIIARSRLFQPDPARFDQFDLGPGRPVAMADLAQDPAWTLYCFDLATDRALFLRMPAGLDLSSAPFVYMAQVEQAQEAATVSTADVIAAGEHLARPERWVHLFSTGRCGSTLASRVFANLDGVWSASEPDAVSTLVTWRDGYGGERMRALLRAASYWSFRPLDHSRALTCVLKYRSEAVFHASDYLHALPESSALFLYRDLVGWSDSVFRFSQKQGVELSPGPADDWRMVWDILSAQAPMSDGSGVFDATADRIGVEEVLAALWVMRIEAFQEAREFGAGMRAISYRELNEAREPAVAKLLQTLGPETDTPENRAKALAAFERDSHAGTAGSRSKAATPLDDAGVGRLHDLARSNARVRSAVSFARSLEV